MLVCSAEPGIELWICSAALQSCAICLRGSAFADLLVFMRFEELILNVTMDCVL